MIIRVLSLLSLYCHNQNPLSRSTRESFNSLSLFLELKCCASLCRLQSVCFQFSSF